MVGLYGRIEHSYCEPVAEAFADSAEIRDWFFVRLGRDDWVGRSVAMRAAQKARRPTARFWWKNYYCGDTRCTCPGLRGREVDILLMACRDDGRTLAIHIECKHPNDRFHVDQAAGYPLRAACWSSGRGGPRSLVPHHEATTVLLCDRSAKHAADDLACFDRLVFFDEVATMISSYPVSASA